MSINNNLEGKTFNHLLVLKELGNKKILCKCLLCGNEKIIDKYKVKTGHTKSCGCLLRKNKHELKGAKIGLLEVIEKAQTKKGSTNEWICKCRCGKYTIVSSSSLIHNRTLSCGCLVSIKSKERFNNKEKGLRRFIKNNTSIKLIEKYMNTTMSNNTTGYIGVYFCKNKKSKQYMASLKFQGKNIFLGYFNTIEQAYKARKEGENKYFKPILDEN